MAFIYQDNQLVCDGVSVATIAAEAGTPFYLYSAEKLRENFAAYANAFAGANVTICFAVKACSNIAILKLLQGWDAGADTVSGGEIRRALLAGVAPEKIIFSGVGKARDEIALALAAGIGQLNVESAEELEIIHQIAAAQKVKVPISFRVNPDVEAGTHDKISTGRKSDKFGVPLSEARELYRKARTYPCLEVRGIACHIGSQITDLRPFEEALARLTELIIDLRGDGIDLERIDVGGGLGVRYRDEVPPTISQYAAAVIGKVGSLGLRLFLEPGRSIAATAGALIARVQLIKPTRTKTFAVLDAGMSELARPAIYGAYHEMIAVRQGPMAATYDVVGPVCESSDVLGTDRRLPRLSAGDLVAVLNAGAYGATMSSNYNTRPLPAEILVEAGAWRVIRERQTFEDMIAKERDGALE